MKLFTIFFAAVLFFSAARAMREDDYKPGVLKNIKIFMQKLKYFAIQKDLPKVIKSLQLIKNSCNYVTTIEKQDIQNNVVILLIKSLPLSSVTQLLFKDEYYGMVNCDSGLSSNDPSPRIEENSFYRDFPDDESEIPHLTQNFLLEERALKQILTSSNSKKRKEFSFLERLIKKLKTLNEEISAAKGDLRVCCQEKKPKNFLRIFEKYGPLLNLEDLNGSGSALIHHIIENKNRGLLLFIIRKGAELEVTNVHGNTPLLQAVQQEQPDVELIKYLIQYGANPYMSNKGGLWEQIKGSKIVLSRVRTKESFDTSTILFHQTQVKKNKIEKILRDYVEHLLVDYKFRFFAQSGKIDEIKVLILSITKDVQENYEADLYNPIIDFLINSTDEKGRSALHFAIQQQNKDMILYLLFIHVDPDMQEFQQKNTPLHIAVISNYLEGVLFLLFGEIENIKNNFQFTYNGARTDIENRHGYTPPQIAELAEYKEICEAFKAKNDKDLKKKVEEAYSEYFSFPLNDDDDYQLPALEDDHKKTIKTSVKSQKKLGSRKGSLRDMLSEIDTDSEEEKEKISYLREGKISKLGDNMDESKQTKHMSLKKNKNGKRRKGGTFGLSSLRKAIEKKDNQTSDN